MSVWRVENGFATGAPPYLLVYNDAVRFPCGPLNHSNGLGPSCEENSKVKIAYRTSYDRRVELGVVHGSGPYAKPWPPGTLYVPDPMLAGITV